MIGEDSFTGNSLVERWGRSAPLDALAWANSLPGDADGVRSAVFHGWAEADVGSARNHLVDRWPDRRFKIPANAVALKLIEDNPAEGFRWVSENLTPAMARGPLDYAIVMLAAKDPNKAARAVESLPPGAAQWRAAVALVANWGKVSPYDQSDAAAAASWASALPEGQLRREALDAAAHGLSVSDPGAAAAFILSTAPEGYPLDVLVETTRALAGSSPDGAIDFALQMTDPVRRNALLEKAFDTMAFDDPAGAARRFLDPQESRFPASALERVADSYFTSNPTSARAWLASLRHHNFYGDVAAALLASSR